MRRFGWSVVLWACTVTPTGLFAEGDFFAPGAFYLDMGTANTNPGPAKAFANTDNNFYAILGLLSSNPETRSASAVSYFVSTARKPTVSGSNQRLGFEYSLTEWAGIGGSVNQSRFEVKNANFAQVLDPAALFLLSFAGGPFNISSPTQPTPVAVYLGILPVSYRTDAIRTTDFDFAFHIPTGPFDPFVRVSIGGGKVGDVTVSKGGLTVGLRWSPTSCCYAFLESFHNRFSFEIEGLITGSVFESGARLGVGLRIGQP